MRKAAVGALVVCSYAMMIGLLLAIVLALTTAFADGFKVRAAAKLVVDRAPQLSPDGRQVAFIRTDAGGRRLWVMGDDGTDQRPLARAERFSWAGGDALLFVRAGRVFRISAAGGGAVRVRTTLRPAAPASERRRVFVRGNHVYLRDAGGHEVALT
jgi:hypothetical protein